MHEIRTYTVIDHLARNDKPRKNGVNVKDKTLTHNTARTILRQMVKTYPMTGHVRYQTQ